jgi:hypothetical protein
VIQHDGDKKAADKGADLAFERVSALRGPGDALERSDLVRECVASQIAADVLLTLAPACGADADELRSAAKARVANVRRRILGGGS